MVTNRQAPAKGRRLWPDLAYAATAEEACAGADVVLLLTEWPEYVSLDPAALGALVHHRRVVDGRNALDAGKWQATGWSYRALGRPTV